MSADEEQLVKMSQSKRCLVVHANAQEPSFSSFIVEDVSRRKGPTSAPFHKSATWKTERAVRFLVDSYHSQQRLSETILILLRRATPIHRKDAAEKGIQKLSRREHGKKGSAKLSLIVNGTTTRSGKLQKLCSLFVLPCLAMSNS
jgi:hypothetical protein